LFIFIAVGSECDILRPFSGSPRRKELLQGLVRSNPSFFCLLSPTDPFLRSKIVSLYIQGLKFEVIPSTFAENLDKSQFSHPSQYVAETAHRKALDVHETIVQQRHEKYNILISADTIVVLDKQIIEKPASVQHAHELLRSLSGRSHHVYTAITILVLNDGDSEPKAHRFVEETEVQFGALSDEQIAGYVATGAPMYAIQPFLGPPPDG
jgi:MAF protein